MAYVTTNPPQLISKAIAEKGQIWEYRSTDASTVVDATGYFTNAKKLGMRLGDRVNVHDTDASPYAVTTHTVVAINADGSADLANADFSAASNSD